MLVHPDRRWLAKQYFVLATLTFFMALCAGLVHLIVTVAADDPGDVGVITWAVAGGLALLMWAISTPAVILWFRNLEYLVEDDKVIIRKGVLTKIQQNIPLRMITDFRLHRSLYDRFLGIGSIQLQTAGQSQTATGYEGKLAGLSGWAALHDELRGRLKAREEMVEHHRLAGDAQDDVHAILEELRSVRRVLEASRG